MSRSFASLIIINYVEESEMELPETTPRSMSPMSATPVREKHTKAVVFLLFPDNFSTTPSSSSMIDYPSTLPVSSRTDALCILSRSYA